MVSTTMPSAPASAMAWACSAKAAFRSSSLTWPIISITPLGPIEAKTFARPAAARREISTPARLISATWSARPVPGEDEAVGPEGVGQDHLAAGLDVGPGDLFDLLGLGEVPGVGAGPDGQAPLLELRAPGPVGHHRAGGEQLLHRWVHDRIVKSEGNKPKDQMV